MPCSGFAALGRSCVAAKGERGSVKDRSTSDIPARKRRQGPDTSSRRRIIPPSDHFDGKRFFNPGVSTDKGWRDLLRWWRSGERGAWPRRVENCGGHEPPGITGSGAASVTFIGHATFLLQLDGITILTDPVFSNRASPFSWAGPMRVRDPGIDIDDLPPIDVVLVSHNHYDHMDIASLRRLRDRWDPVILTGLGNRRYLGRKGLRNCLEFDWWETTAVDHAKITFVPAQHWSRRGLFDRRRTLWGGFVLQTASSRVFFAGDTGYPGHFRAIRERLGAPDIALLPIGAYEPRWFMAAQHMNPEEAVLAHLDLGARVGIGMHFGTFQLTDEGIHAPVEALSEACSQYGVAPNAFRVLDFGETCRWSRGPAAIRSFEETDEERSSERTLGR